MCKDKRVFDAMMNAGTPCPKDGLIGADAKAAWEVADAEEPEELKEKIEEFTSDQKTLIGSGIVATLALLLLL